MKTLTINLNSAESVEVIESRHGFSIEKYSVFNPALGKSGAWVNFTYEDLRSWQQHELTELENRIEKKVMGA